MKKTIFATVLAIAGMMFTTSVSAQDNDNRAARRAEFQARQTERLMKDLKLTDEQKQKFEPAYQRYLEELNATLSLDEANNRSQQDYDKLTDAEATEQLQQHFTRQEAQLLQQQTRLEIQKKYLAEFSAILTPQQLLRVFRPQNQRNGNDFRGRGGRGPRGGFGDGQRGGFGDGQRGGFGGPRNNDF